MFDQIEELTSFEIQTDSAERLGEELSIVAPGVRFSPTKHRPPFDAKVTGWRLPRTGFFRISMDDVSVRVASHHDFLSITIPFSGFLKIADGSGYSLYEPRSLHVADPDSELDLVTTSGSTTFVANIARDLFESVAAAHGAFDRGSTLLPTARLRESNAANTLRAYLTWLHADLAAGGPTVQNPQTAIEAENLLAALIADALAEPDGGDIQAVRRRPNRAGLQKAEEFLASSLSTPVSLIDVARAADLSIRTLTRGFHDHHGIGPIAFLRILRLDAARQELMTTQTPDVRVIDIAALYEMYHTGRFAADYRQRFGESPSMTLRRRLTALGLHP